MPAHRTEKVKLGAAFVDIDEPLAPLIRLLWARGVMTNQCCQEGRPGEACIEFPGTAEVEEFLFVAQRPYKVELETRDGGEGGHLAFRVRLLVFFPAADILRLAEAFSDDEPPLAVPPPSPGGSRKVEAPPLPKGKRKKKGK